MSEPTDSANVQWWIRSASNGDIFGPVPLSDLADWARQSRVFPEDAVSTDRRAWRTARTVPELGMDTVIATPDGRIHGPLHADAAASLVEKGKLPEGSKVFSSAELLSVGASNTQADVSAEVVAEAKAAAAKQVEEALAKVGEAEAAAEASARALEAIKTQTADALAEKEREIETLRTAADSAASEIAEAKEAAAKEIAATKEAATKEVAEAKEAAAKEIADVKEVAAKDIAEAKAADAKDIAEAKAAAEREVAEAKEAAAKEIAEAKAAVEKEDAEAKAAVEREVAEAKETAAKEVADAKERLAKIAASVEATSDELRLAKASLEKAVAERESVISERDSVIAERDAAISERDAAIVDRDAAIAERDTAVKNAEEAVKEASEAKAAVESLEKQLEEQASELAELADFANARDRESKATVAELERRIAEISAPDVPPPSGEDGPIGDARLVQTLQERVTDLTRERCSLSEKLAAAEASLAVATRPLDADTALVKRFADEALDALREAFASEKERNDAERTASVQRQNALHDRIADLERALRRQPGEKTRGELAEERSERTISQLRQELDALREQHKADLGRASENERALEGRLQALQHREAAVREQLRRVEKRTADYDSLTSRLRRREEEIVEAEKQFGEARTQWQVVEQMLRRRIDELEHGAGSLFENDPEQDPAAQSQKLVLPGWVRNMK